MNLVELKTAIDSDIHFVPATSFLRHLLFVILKGLLIKNTFRRRMIVYTPPIGNTLFINDHIIILSSSSY